MNGIPVSPGRKTGERPYLAPRRRGFFGPILGAIPPLKTRKYERDSCIPGPKNGERPYLAVLWAKKRRTPLPGGPLPVCLSRKNGERPYLAVPEDEKRRTPLPGGPRGPFLGSVFSSFYRHFIHYSSISSLKLKINNLIIKIKI